MLYKFRIVSDEVENFKLEILIDSDDTFMRLRNAILDAVGYDRNQLDSFFICEDDVWLMEDTLLSDLIEDEGQKLTFMFDYVTGRQFYMEMKEIITNKILHDPLCQRKEGKAPAQLIDIDVYDQKLDAASSDLGDLGEDFYGDQSYDDEELSSLEGIEGVDE